MNEGLGGTIEFGENDEYLFPRDLPADKVRQILQEDQAAEVYGSQLPGFSVVDGDSIRYDIIDLPSQDSVAAIGVYDTDGQEVLDFYEIDELVEEASTV